MTHKDIRAAVDTLTLYYGKKENGLYRATFTVKEVLERLGVPNTQFNQDHIKYVIKQWYHGVKILPGQSDNGGFVQVSVRSV